MGSGAAATVFEAAHPDLGTTVALKMLSHSLVAHAGFSSHFAKEGRTTAKLDHPNIVRILDTERAYGTLFIVMERLHGTVLSELLEGGEQLPSRKVRIILMDCCRALAYTHEAGLVHRDIKPSNLFMTQDGVAKLLDFGIAANMEDTSTNSERVGTPYYMSPEQIRGRSLDGRADLYSLGIMAFRLLTGRLPFNAADLKDLLKKHLHSPFPSQAIKGKGYPQDLVRFIEISTRKNPAHRYSSCTEALMELTSGRELPFVHSLLVGQVQLRLPKEEEELLQKVLKGFRGLLSIYGIRFVEGRVDKGGEILLHFSITAHPSHRQRVEGAISAMKGLLKNSGLDGDVTATWSPEEPKDEEEKVAFPKDILTSS